MTTKENRSPRARNAEATRAALLEAATKRFTLLGYERTTTRDIARDAGANISLLARYFGSKEGLFAEVLRESAHALDKLRSLDDGDLVTSIVDGLSRDQWLEFGGEHPLLLLVRGLEEEKVNELRRRLLDNIANFFTERTASPGGNGSGTALRGDLVLAVVVGLLTIRSTRPHSPLAGADTTQLRIITERFLAAIAAMG
ncbi:TetR/AcrR family transcriptional regulator [Allobranchiibius sp. CTAmp26]|uniref:TetR/AcrR family transcriptional regulator n=1 Tax=Allobranchiibius sp. CTAmp26 TaxID=2815214 RepID=UPI001AA153A9|nr:TetR/AcrR family transcriptional regulator [Allobranchiibius sp. CTAmp26]MBO1756953.1 TetR/AcrR family transcriptional regulator [Allobranchiibius sp. CTAmp26]